MNLKMSVNNGRYWVRKNSPYLLFGLGVITLLGAVGEAVHATTKLGYSLDKHDDNVLALELKYNEALEACENEQQAIENEKDYNKEIKKVYMATVWDVTKLYLPTIALTALSLVSFGGSFSILNKRYTGVAMALTATTKAFDNYRARVRAEEDGEIKDYAYLHGLDIEETTVTEVDEDGKKHKVTVKTLTGNPTGLYSYRWEKYNAVERTGSTQWDNASAYAIPYIENVIRICQARLDDGKIVWLGDILSDLGFDDGSMTGCERIAGWKKGDLILCGLEENGLSKVMSQDTLDFLYGDSADVTLIFNPRPNLYDEVYGKPDVIDVPAKEVTNE